MANVLISNLPSWTGSAADLRWFIMNNSGETETFKFSGYTSPYKSATQPFSVISNYSSTEPIYPYSQILGGSGNTISTQIEAMLSIHDFNTTFNATNNYHNGLPPLYLGNKGSTLKGGLNISNYNITNTTESDAGVFMYNQNGNINSPGNSVIIACVQPQINATAATLAIGSYNPVVPNGAIRSTFLGGYTNAKNGTGDVNTFIAATSSSINNTTNWASIINSNASSVNGGDYNSIFNANNSSISSTSSNNTIVGGSNNSFGSGVASSTITAAYNNSNIQGCNLGFIAGTQDNTITSMGYTYVLVGGGYNTINAVNASAGNAMYSSYFCTDNTTNDNSVLGNSNNWFAGSRNSNLVGYGKHNWIANSYNSSITNNVGADVGEWFNSIISSSASTMTTSQQSHIFGGENNTISGRTRAVMIGTSGRTADADNTTYVENLKSFGQIYGATKNLGSVSSGTTTLNFNEGNIQYFQLNAGVSATLNATNYKEGATYIVKVKQPSSGAAATLSYSSPLFKFPNGIAPTLSVNNDEEDILSFVCIGGTLYGNIQKTFI